MRASGRDWLVTILRYSLTRDDNNNPIHVWTELAQVWAEKLDISDGERLRAAQLDAQITTRFRLLWSEQIKDVSPKDRLALDGREYDIAGVKEIGRRDGLEITANVRADL